MESIISRFLKINFLKTIYTNFKFLPFRQAIRFPILVYWNTIINGDGNITILNNVTPFMIQIGMNGLGIVDGRYQRTKLLIDGELVATGQTRLRGGVRISIGKKAKLILGNNFNISGNTSIITEKQISFGDNCLISWEVLIMDTDYHNILDTNYNKLNNDKPIKVGNNVWIGCRSTILKGVTIADNCVIAACSEVTKSLDQSNSVYGGKGRYISVIKENINWKE